MPIRFFILIAFLATAFTSAFAQNADDALRLYDNNNIAWYQTAATVRLHEKWEAVGEFAWRRTDWGANWLQHLSRVGVNYRLNDGVEARLGYCFVETYAYGDYPTLKETETQLEHRAYQHLQFKSKVGRIDFANRLRLEQRWIGKHLGTENIAAWSYSNRIRYQIRADVPLQGQKLDDKEFYAAAFDEVFVGWGVGVGANIFDQNRLGLMVGYKLNKHVKLEGGYFNHILQQGKLVNNKAVIQLNDGIMVNAIFNFDAS
jgi:Protein of unknown function (DUF2490)